MDYLIEKLLPRGQVHLLSGASGSGKTTFLLQHLPDIREGRPFFGHPTHHVSLYYIGCDRPIEEYEEKFDLLRIPLFPIISLISDPTFRPQELVRVERRMALLDKILIQARQNQPDVNLLVFDPLSPFLTSKLGDYHAVADSLVELMRWCDKNHITVLGTHHATKLKPDTAFKRVQDRTLGSAALLGYSGTQIFLSSPEELGKPYASVTFNPHNYPPLTINLTRDENGRFQEYEDIGLDNDPSGLEGRDLEWWAGLSDTFRFADILDLGASKSAASRFRKRLLDKGLVEECKEKGIWRKKEIQYE